MGETYKQLVFTNHALERMHSRRITKDAIWQTIHNPDRSIPEDKPDTARFIRTLSDRTYHAVATYLPDQKKTLVISAWVRGEEDAVPLVWRIITAPFTLVWWIASTIFHTLFSRKSS